MKAIVCGGREYSNRDAVFKALHEIGVTHVISGGARGADDLAATWAITYLPNGNLTIFKADWRKYGKAAGPIRNQQMIDEGKPSVVVAFSGGRGTADMIRRAKNAGIKVYKFA